MKEEIKMWLDAILGGLAIVALGAWMLFIGGVLR